MQPASQSARPSQLADLLASVGRDGHVDADETRAIRGAVFPDGVVDRAEAGALFQLAGRVANDDAAWAEAFCEAIGDHMIGDDGFVSDENAAWLLGQTRQHAALAVPLLVKVLERAESAPESLAAAARDAVLAAVAAAPMGKRETEWVRTCLYALAGDGAAHVTDSEARWLFALDAATDGRDNDPAWPDLFVKAMLNHVMSWRPSALIDRSAESARRDWLKAPVTPAPLGFLARAFEGGVKGWRERVQFTEVDAFEQHYAQRLDDAVDDARLTPEEVADIVARVRADGRETANGARLLEELGRFEAAQSA